MVLFIIYLIIVWYGEAPLYSFFPSLYSIASSKGARVAALWVFSRSWGG